MKFGKLLADTLSLPIDIVKDVATCGGVAIESAIKKRFHKIYDDLSDE